MTFGSFNRIGCILAMSLTRGVACAKYSLLEIGKSVGVAGISFTEKVETAEKVLKLRTLNSAFDAIWRDVLEVGRKCVCMYISVLKIETVQVSARPLP